MILISHRGNINGKNSLENNPDYVINALYLGYDCEIDVRYENDRWFLGHDKKQYKTNKEFLLQKGLWLHAKNILTLHALLKLDINCFFHDKDNCTLTSKGYVWTHPGFSLEEKSICVLPELYPKVYKKFNCAGICSDYIEKYKNE